MTDFVVALVLMVPLQVIRGFTVSVLWGWYAVPYLNLPPLGVVPAIGLSLLVGVWWAEAPAENHASRGAPYVALYHAIACALALLIGWAWRFAL